MVATIIFIVIATVIALFGLIAIFEKDFTDHELSPARITVEARKNLIKRQHR